MESMRKEIRNRRILAIIAVLVIGIAYFVSGQVNVYSRYDNRPDIKTYTPTDPIEIGDIGGNKGDDGNFFISMYVDKISKDTSNISVFVYMNKGRDISKYDLIVKFSDGSFLKLNRDKINIKDNYAEYIVDKDALDRFYWMRVENFLFKSSDASLNINAEMVKPEHKVFFMDMLHVCFK